LSIATQKEKEMEIETRGVSSQPTDPDSQGAGPAESGKPARLTVWEKGVMTVKILAGFALIGVALWGFETWTGR
jgi:hypothetical protein